MEKEDTNMDIHGERKGILSMLRRCHNEYIGHIQMQQCSSRDDQTLRVRRMNFAINLQVKTFGPYG